MFRRVAAAAAILVVSFSVNADNLSAAVKKDYDDYLWPLFDHFHRNPELSLIEHDTAARMASELRAAGFEVTEGVGGTGVVAMMENGDGPLVMMRADMDGLPVQEKSGLENASRKKQVDPITGNEVFTMHACGHDMHITSLVGTARQMAARRDDWSGTLMLLVQPAEERGMGAKMMREDDIWKRFGKPDYALALHVNSLDVAGKVNITPSPFAGADSVDIIIHGVGAHGAHPYAGKDPIVLGSQIVLALQTLVARELPPRWPGVVTVGSFHSGTKHNIISDRAHLQLTVRNTSPETREILLNGIKRIAENMGRVAGLPEDKLPEVIVAEREAVPSTVNTPELTERITAAWEKSLGDEAVISNLTRGMGAEDFPFFVIDPDIPSVYWQIGGTPQAAFDAEAAGGPPVPSHHSPLFKISPEPSVRAGVESTVVALMELMPVE
jgi:hippurate hydrolase